MSQCTPGTKIILKKKNEEQKKKKQKENYYPHFKLDETESQME
jgi:hypothetical protein